eukprot:3456931-Rhodomonas_salina.1
MARQWVASLRLSHGDRSDSDSGLALLGLRLWALSGRLRLRHHDGACARILSQASMVVTIVAWCQCVWHAPWLDS